MTARSTVSKPKPKDSGDRKTRKEHLDEVLDEGLEETFPASDTPSVVRPGHGIPTGEDGKKSG